MEKVSIIIPIYNSDKTIDRCLKSIINQTYRNIEVICINDGSFDNSYKILQNYLKTDSRIKVINQTNKGVSSARNNGIKNSTGKYIMFVDADDYLKDNMIELLVKSIKKDSSDLLICNYDVKCKNYIKEHKSIKNDKVMNKKEFLKDYGKFQKGELINQPWNKLYIKSKIRKLFDESMCLGEDLIFNVNYIENIEKISYIDENLYVYDLTIEDSLTKKYKQDGQYFLQLYKEVYKIVFVGSNVKPNLKINWWLLKNYIYILNLNCKEKKIKMKYQDIKR